MTLLEQRDAAAQRTREQALAQGLARFPPDGGGPTTVDRYTWPETFTLEAWRAVRLAPIVRGGVR